MSPPLRVPRLIERYGDMFVHICRETGDVRNFGSAALHLCYVACGRAEAYFEYGLKYHDIAAGMVILAAAGGRISAMRSADRVPQSTDIIASNAALHPWYTATIGRLNEEHGTTAPSYPLLR